MRRRRHPLSTLLTIALFLFSTGSLVVAGDPTDPVWVRSQPSATVVVDGEVEGRTPLLVHLSRSAAHSIRIEHPGYQVQEVLVRPVLSWGGLRHVLFGGGAIGTLGSALDVAAGGGRALSPSEVDVILTRTAEIEMHIAPRVPWLLGTYLTP